MTEEMWTNGFRGGEQFRRSLYDELLPALEAVVDWLAGLFG